MEDRALSLWPQITHPCVATHPASPLVRPPLWPPLLTGAPGSVIPPLGSETVGEAVGTSSCHGVLNPSQQQGHLPCPRSAAWLRAPSHLLLQWPPDPSPPAPLHSRSPGLSCWSPAALYTPLTHPGFPGLTGGEPASAMNTDVMGKTGPRKLCPPILLSELLSYDTLASAEWAPVAGQRDPHPEAGMGEREGGAATTPCQHTPPFTASYPSYLEIPINSSPGQPEGYFLSG